MVYRLTGPDDPNHDDLVQEGMIAMWRAEEKYDPAKGAKASWLIKAAEMRVKNLAFGTGQPLGHQPRRGVKTMPKPVYLEELRQENEDFEPWACEMAEGLALAYHSGDIYRALGDLTPPQRSAALKVMYDLPRSNVDGAHWSNARKKLHVRLQHLSDCG